MKTIMTFQGVKYKMQISDIHFLINLRMYRVIDRYLKSLHFSELSVKEIRHKLKIPKNLTYGGHRNTCYDLSNYIDTLIRSECERRGWK